jgi:electron transfer flavoprotein beta subunit
VTVVKDINQPRYPNFRGIRRARRMELPVWGPDELADAQASLLGMEGSPTKVVKVYTPPKRSGEVVMIEGDSAAETAGSLADKLIADKVV